MSTITTRSAVLAILLLALAASKDATAGPLLVRHYVDLTLPQPGLSALCGFNILRRIEGFVDTALFFDDQGNPAREIDTSPTTRTVAILTGTATHSLSTSRV